MDAKLYDEAINQYSAALSLDAGIPRGLIMKRSKVYITMGLWEDAINDTNQVCPFCLS